MFLRFLLALAVLISLMSICRPSEQITVNYVSLNNFKPHELNKIKLAGKVIERVVNSQQFKERVIAHNYKGQYRFVDTEMSNEEVYKKIMEAAENYKEDKDGVIDLHLEMYYSMFKTVGYTYNSKPTVYLNRKFYDGFDYYEATGNLFHEWLHKLGFMHTQEDTDERPYSVPYALGYLMEELASNLKYDADYLTPVKGAVAPLPTLPKYEPSPVVVCGRTWKTLWLLRTCWVENK